MKSALKTIGTGVVVFVAAAAYSGSGGAGDFLGEVCWSMVDDQNPGEPDLLRAGVTHAGNGKYFTLQGTIGVGDPPGIVNGGIVKVGKQYMATLTLSMDGSADDNEQVVENIQLRLDEATLSGTWWNIGAWTTDGKPSNMSYADSGPITFTSCP